MISTILAFALLCPIISAQPTELFFSEYIEGSSNNKALEIFNGTGAAINLAAGGYDIQMFFNGSASAGLTIALTGAVANGDVYVVAHSSADPTILAQADQTNGAGWFNGNDAVVLRKSGVIIDSIGQVGFNPGTEWGSGLTSTQDNTLRRMASICAGDTNATDSFDPSIEWDGFANNTFDGLGAHSVSCGGGGPSGPAPLLLTEIVVTPTAGEFVEIHNPTGSAVDLSDYYLTDATFAGGGTFYYNIVTGMNAGGGGFADFHARFPAGAMIGPGEYQTIAMAGSDDFFASYGINPTYELFEDGVGADAIPDMREALPGSINGQGGLTNAGEVVILYFWDGATDLVTDVDYALWGDKDEAVDKTSVSIDGPDADMIPSSYLPDTMITLQDVIAPGSHASGAAFQRIDLLEGTETLTGGNGVGGNDETSENLSVTWSSGDAPTPGAPAPSGWIINEIHADPDTVFGDANGDGTSNFSDDEFVEIVNTTGSDQDISGWTLSDGFGVRHTFPAGTMVANNCAIVVFGGGSPTGLFGSAVVQTASTGALGLNNGGDSVTMRNTMSAIAASESYGAEGGDNQSLTRSPDITGAFVKHTTAAPGVLFSPGTKLDRSSFDGCAPPPMLEIFEIQGSGLASPFDGLVVETDDNVVTAVASNGFFIQTPSARTDGDVDTSDGIFVFTGGAPTVAVGDQVDVIARVQEFFNFTELSNVISIGVDLSGASLPPAVSFDAAVPSPDPTAPSCSIEFECYEGMLIEIADGTVTGPNQRFSSDTIAEVFITAASIRTFREPGILYPGIFPFPVWDGNPEVFELDPDKLGLPNQIIPAGSSFSAVGVLGFEFGGYELWPTSLAVVPAPLPVPVRPREAGEFTVGSLNLFRLFDDIDDPPDMNSQGEIRNDTVVSITEYLRRRAKLARYILDVLDAPDILAVQEAEKLGVLQDLAADIMLVDPSVVYSAYLIEGNDVGTIDTGFLVRSTVQVDAVTQLGKEELLSVDGSLLHDRPPLLLEGSYLCPCDTGFDSGDDDDDDDAGCVSGPSFPLKVIAVHNRSLGGIEDPVDGARVRQKRLEQAESLATKIQAMQMADPDLRLVVLGDFNAFEFTDGYVDAVGHISGSFNPADELICDTNACPDLVDPDLTNQVLSLPPEQRYSFIFAGSAQVLDHALTSQGLAALVQGFEYGRGNADAALELINDGMTLLRATDHDGLVLYLSSECPRALKSEAIDILTAALPTGDPQTDQRISKAIESIVDSLASELWVDGRHLSPQHGGKVFDEEKKAVGDLVKAAHPAAAAAGVNLLIADDLLAGVPIDEAIAFAQSLGCTPSSGNPCKKILHELAKAQEEFAQARQEILSGNFEKAIDNYKKAWEHALKALGGG